MPAARVHQIPDDRRARRRGLLPPGGNSAGGRGRSRASRGRRQAPLGAGRARGGAPGGGGRTRALAGPAAGGAGRRSRLASCRAAARGPSPDGLEARAEADLALGRHHQALGDLQRLAANEPLREPVHALLMLALYRCGREADALRVYDDLRRRLSVELGAEPSAKARRLHQAGTSIRIQVKQWAIRSSRPDHTPNSTATSKRSARR